MPICSVHLGNNQWCLKVIDINLVVPFVNFAEMTMLGSLELEICFTMAWLLWLNLKRNLVRRDCKFCPYILCEGTMVECYLCTELLYLVLIFGIQDLMVECSNFRLMVPLKLNESYLLKAKKDIKELTLQVVLDKFIQFSCNIKEV